MAPIAGKRKRRKESSTESDPPSFETDKLKAIMKEDFEAAFEPLPDAEWVPANLSAGDGESEDSRTDDWEGISDANSGAREVVDCTIHESEKRIISNKGLRKFMV